MKRFLFALLLPTLALAQQGQPDPAMTRMRDAMKKLVQRITEAESQMVTAQAAQIAAEAQVKELTAKLEKTTKDLQEMSKMRAAEKTAADKSITDLEKKVADRDKQIGQYAEALGKWKEGFEKAQSIAIAKEGEREEAAGRSVELQRKIAEHEQKNREMYRLGREILERYEKFGLGTALMSREPFVGSMRVKFENYIQDYGDKLETHKISGADPKVVEGKPPATSEQPKKP